MEISVKVDINLDKIDMGKVNQIGLVNSTQKIAKLAKERAPYDTGTLKKSIGVDPGQITRATTETRVGPRKVVYAVRREFENKKNPDRRFYMKRTYDDAERIVQEEFKKAVNIVISNI